MMEYLEYKGYRGTVEYSKEDNCLFGKVVGMSKDCITYEGESLAELQADFEAGIDDYIAGCEAHGITPRKPYSGNINLRMKPEVHSKVAMVAEQLGTSINEYINQIIVNDLNNTIYNKQLLL